MTDEATHDRDGHSLELQPGCEPKHLLPSQGPIIGTAILVHGYTGCPQQYFELADLLTAAGIEVYLPLSPGHGRVLNENGQEDLRGMPGRYEDYLYRNFSDEINELAAASSGLKILAGLSGGATIAAYAMNAAAVPYDRVVLMSPLFHEKTDPLESFVLSIERLLPLGFGQVVKWGDSCLAQRAHGRAGYCQSSFSNLAAAETFGQSTLRQLKPAQTHLQIVAVENDTAADVPTIVRAVEKMEVPARDVCFMPNGIPHSFFSRFDNIDDNPTWIPAFEKNFVEYVVKGTPFPPAAPSIVSGFNQCPVK
jgi:carboxylesterase